MILTIDNIRAIAQEVVAELEQQVRIHATRGPIEEGVWRMRDMYAAPREKRLALLEAAAVCLREIAALDRKEKP